MRGRKSSLRVGSHSIWSWFPPHPPFGHPLPAGARGTRDAPFGKASRAIAKWSPSPQRGEGWGEGPKIVAPGRFAIVASGRLAFVAPGRFPFDLELFPPSPALRAPSPRRGEGRKGGLRRRGAPASAGRAPPRWSAGPGGGGKRRPERSRSLPAPGGPRKILPAACGSGAGRRPVQSVVESTTSAELGPGGNPGCCSGYPGSSCCGSPTGRCGGCCSSSRRGSPGSRPLAAYQERL